MHSEVHGEPPGPTGSSPPPGKGELPHGEGEPQGPHRDPQSDRALARSSHASGGPPIHPPYQNTRGGVSGHLYSNKHRRRGAWPARPWSMEACKSQTQSDSPRPSESWRVEGFGGTLPGEGWRRSPCSVAGHKLCRRLGPSWGCCLSAPTSTLWTFCGNEPELKVCTA